MLLRTLVSTWFGSAPFSRSVSTTRMEPPYRAGVIAEVLVVEPIRGLEIRAPWSSRSFYRRDIFLLGQHILVVFRWRWSWVQCRPLDEGEARGL